MLEHLEKTKESMRVRDFDDLEIGVSQLMASAANASYLQARLDAKYSHILIDEFQDTNPLQWQILRSWLDGYGDDGTMPTVFIVGDPKQSIYRFRRADPRLFESAQLFLKEKLNAAYLPKNTTKRNAPAINKAVNDIFLAGALPPAIKELRIVKIGDFDTQADGGTHVKTTSEIGKIEIVAAENKGKNNTYCAP